MAKRYCGDVTVDIKYLGTSGDNYKVSVCAPSGDGRHRYCFRTKELRPPRLGFRFAYDSPEAYDEMAKAAVGFASADLVSEEDYDPKDYSGGDPETVVREISDASIACMGEDDYLVARARGAAPGPRGRRKRQQKEILGTATGRATPCKKALAQLMLVFIDGRACPSKNPYLRPEMKAGFDALRLDQHDSDSVRVLAKPTRPQKQILGRSRRR
jgi:hypothetical protein